MRLQDAPAPDTVAEAPPLTSVLAEWASARLEALTAEPWLQAAAVAAAGVLLSKLAAWVIGIGVKVFTRRTRTDLDDRIVDLLHSPVVRSVALLGFAVAGRLVIASEPLANLFERLLYTLLALAWVLFLFRAGRLLLRTAQGHPTRFQVLRGPAFPLFENAVKLLAIFVAGWLLISVWHLDTTGWLASAGILGIAIGFAAQETLANLFAGVFILADKPYKVGDFIIVDSADRGRVLHIGLRSTRLLSVDGAEITVPNRLMGQAKITNLTGGPSPQVRIAQAVGVAYGSDVTQVRRVLLEAVAACRLLDAEPAPAVRFRGLGDSSLNFEVFAWVSGPERLLDGTDELLQQIYEGLNRAGIGIPFPQREIRIAPASGGFPRL